MSACEVALALSLALCADCGVELGRISDSFRLEGAAANNKKLEQPSKLQNPGISLAHSLSRQNQSGLEQHVKHRDADHGLLPPQSLRAIATTFTTETCLILHSQEKKRVSIRHAIYHITSSHHHLSSPLLSSPPHSQVNKTELGKNSHACIRPCLHF